MFYNIRISPRFSPFNPQHKSTMHLQCRSLSYDFISQTTPWNLHPWTGQDCKETLHASFIKLGIISPPIVMQTGDNSFVIISGHRRIQFGRTYLQESYIDCRVIKKDIESHLLFDIILHDFPDPTALSLAEKAQFLYIASKFFRQETLASRFFDKLGIKRKHSFLNDLFRLLDQDDNFIKLTHNGLIEEQMLSELLRLKIEDRSALIQLFSHFNLGASKQKKFFNLVRDAAYKENVSLMIYLQREEILAITEDISLNAPQKINHLDQFLQQSIYPQSFEAEKEFAAQIKTFNLPKNQIITHSQAFEKNTVTLSTEFPSLERCKSFLQKVDKLG